MFQHTSGAVHHLYDTFQNFFFSNLFFNYTLKNSSFQLFFILYQCILQVTFKLHIKNHTLFNAKTKTKLTTTYPNQYFQLKQFNCTYHFYLYCKTPNSYQRVTHLSTLATCCQYMPLEPCYSDYSLLKLHDVANLRKNTSSY